MRTRSRALAAPSPPVESQEEAIRPAAKDQPGQRGCKRRALTDVTNDDQGLPARRKSVASKAQAPIRDAPPPAAAAAAEAAACRPCTRAAAKAAAKAAAGVSLSELLARRSQQARARSGAAQLPDIDRGMAYNELAASDYAADIHRFYKRVEGRFRVHPEYMDNQASVNHLMRGILIDWLVEVHDGYKLFPETLFLAVNIMDRYLNTQPDLPAHELQLVGMAALHIASKYEEVWPPPAAEWLMMSAGAYTKQQLLRMEVDILTALGHQISVPTCHQFLARYLKASGEQNGRARTAVYAEYIAVLALTDYGMLKYAPSEIAAAAVHVALEAFEMVDSYPHALRMHSGYTKTALQASVRDVVRMLQDAVSSVSRHATQATHRKYASTVYHHVAEDTPVPLHLLARRRGGSGRSGR